MSQAEAVLISVVLCTYNRCDLMAAALRSLCQQTLAASLYEIIVVDNNSTDHTKQYVDEASQAYPHIRYRFEEKQGLSHARNAGLLAARGLYVAYVDDDFTAPKEWLCVAHDIIGRIGPTMFGGPYRPFYNATKPSWYRDRYGTYDVGSVARAVAADEYLTGTNMFFRRSVLERLGGFSPDVGMAGDRLGYGEETVIQRRICEECPDALIYYDPRLWVCHLVRAEKMRMLWCARQMFVSGRDWQRVLVKTSQGPVCQPFRSCIRAGRAVCSLITGLLRGLVARDKSRYPFVANYLYEVVFVHLQALGAAYEQLSRRCNRESVHNGRA